MILDSYHVENDTVLNSDICIIGSGPAAISIALDLIDQKAQIIMLAGGGWSENSYNRDLNNGFVEPDKSHESLKENRRRQFGGASTAWGGRCIPFDPIDFEKRDWIPKAEWPITYEDLSPYYLPALQLCEAGNCFDFNAVSVFPDKQKEIIKGLDNEDIYSWPMERWSPPTNFALHYKQTLNQASNLKILLNAHAIEFILKKDNSEQIDHVIMMLNGKKAFVKARYFVLATGGIENARLLLNSKSELYPVGLGNRYNNVGRYYMGHLMGTFSSIDPKDRKNMIYDFEKDHEGVYCRRRWWFSPKAQKQYNIGNCIMYLHRSLNVSGHRDPLFSSVYLAKSVNAILRKKRVKEMYVKAKEEMNSTFFSHLKITFKQFPLLAPQLYRLMKMRNAKRRLPFILPSVNSKNLYLYFQSEQLPNPDSRIELSNQKDSLGLFSPIIKISFLQQDIETIVTAHKLFVNRFESASAGKVYFNENELRQYLKAKIEHFNSAAHHLGTTRMSSSPKDGVVDANSRVHDVSNLFVAGASVFSTSGHANPTLTIIALSLKLSDRLKSLL